MRTEADVAKLAVPDIEETLGYVTGAVREIRRALTDGQVPPACAADRFSGSPWTLACYMVEGGGSDDFRTVKSMAYSRPDLMHRILDVNAQAVAAYLNAQIEAGAQAVMIFDTWGGALADGAYQRFSLDYIRRVVSQLKREHDGERVPGSRSRRAAGCGSRRSRRPASTRWGSTGRSTGQARERVAGKVALQGNLDPTILFAPPAAVREQRVRCSTAMATIRHIQPRARYFAIHVARSRRRTRRRSYSHSRAIRSGAAG